MSIKLYAKPLSAAEFAPFGEVIEVGDAALDINAGTAASFTDLANIDVANGAGSVSVNIYEAEARALPHAIKMMEQHPLGSQAFIPMNGQKFVTMVSPNGVTPSADNIKIFISNGAQGINLAKGTWHHPFFALDGGLFLVIDRKGEGNNYVEHHFDHDAFMVYEK